MLHRRARPPLPSWSELRDQTERGLETAMAIMGLPGTDLGQLRKTGQGLAAPWPGGRCGGHRPAAAAASAGRGAGRRPEPVAAGRRSAGAGPGVRVPQLAQAARAPPAGRAVAAATRTSCDEQTDPAEELLRLACLTYGADARVRPARAAAVLDEHPELAGATIFTAAATGSVSDLDRDFSPRTQRRPRAEGGPHRWPPLLYLCYQPDPRRSARTVQSRRCPAAARRRRRPGRRLPLGRAGAAVHRADRGLRGW